MLKAANLQITPKKQVADDRYNDEIRFLRADIFRWEEADPLTVWLGATECFRR